MWVGIRVRAVCGLGLGLGPSQEEPPTNGCLGRDYTIVYRGDPEMRSLYIQEYIVYTALNQEVPPTNGCLGRDYTIVYRGDPEMRSLYKNTLCTLH